MAEIDSEQLVKEFYAPLYRFGLSLSRNQTDAGDLVQQTFVTWATKGHQLRDTTKVKTWLFTTLYRDFLEKKRHAKRFVEAEDALDFVAPTQVAPSVVDALDAAIVQKVLHSLDDRYRAPVTLFYMKQHSYREIAKNPRHSDRHRDVAHLTRESRAARTPERCRRAGESKDRGHGKGRSQWIVGKRIPS